MKIYNFNLLKRLFSKINYIILLKFFNMLLIKNLSLRGMKA